VSNTTLIISLITTSFFCDCVALSSQNLVPNPSFEDTIGCPLGNGGDFDKVALWMNSGISPDYYNICANTTNGFLGVPSNFLGYQSAFHGNAYAGIIAWYAPSTREFIGIQLTQTMTLGTKYFVSAYISKADSGEIPPYTCSCNNFGFRFSTIAYDWGNGGNPVPIDNFSQVHSESIITDTANWTRIEGSFVADSAFQYLYIGNFYDDANTDTLECNYFQGYAYYYIDAVCVSVDSMTCTNWTGINENNTPTSKINPYPNPANNILFVNNFSEEITYTLTNLAGQKIKQGKLSSLSNQINVSTIEDGIYFFNLGTSNFKILIIH